MNLQKDLDPVPVKFDSTDHFWFECPDCGTHMAIRPDGVKTEVINKKNGTVTRFLLVCPMCKGEGYRKIYWQDGTIDARDLKDQQC